MTFNGHTCVAFLDIAGFKKMMNNRQKAYHALDCFYEIGYDELSNQANHTPQVNGLFVTDCGILFSTHDNDQEVGKVAALKTLLQQWKQYVDGCSRSLSGIC